MIQFKKYPGQKVIELGCGDRPHPDADCWVDCRPGPHTSFVADFNEPLPISDDEWDAVYSCFVIEHISWRKAPQFVREVARILKPGGSVVLVMPNTEAQMRHLLKTQDWDDAGSMLFGDQDYPENSHKSAFSPAYITKLLSQAGFEQIKIMPFGELQTDIIVTAMKEKVPSIEQVVAEGALGQMTSAEGRLAQSEATFIPDFKREVEQSVVTHPCEDDYKINIFGSNVEQVETLKTARERERLEEQRLKTETFIATESKREQVGEFSIQIISTTEETPQTPPESIGPVQGVMSQSELSELILGGSRGVPEKVPEPLTEKVVSAGQNTVQDYTPDQWFDHAYFDGGAKVGGYKAPGYRDFPTNEIIAREVLERKPFSALELGCGRGYVLKRVQDAGVKAFGIDVSKHCQMTSVATGQVRADLTVYPWPFENYSDLKDLNTKSFPTGQIDLCYSVAFLDHIPEHLLPNLIHEMKRVSKRGLHALDFSPYDGFDRTRITINPKEWWEAFFKEHDYPCEVIDKKEWEDPNKFPPEVLQGDGRLKLNLGSCTTMFHHGWLNVDVLDLEGFAQGNGYRYLRHDIRNGLTMFGTGVVDLIYLGHFFEHLSYDEGAKLLKELRRVIRPDGVMRILVPDLSKLLDCYTRTGSTLEYSEEPHLLDFDHVNWGCFKAKTPAQKLWSLVHDGHQAAYDSYTLVAMLTEAGFNARQVNHRATLASNNGHQMLRETLDLLPSLSLIVEATASTV